MANFRCKCRKLSLKASRFGLRMLLSALLRCRISWKKESFCCRRWLILVNGWRVEHGSTKGREMDLFRSVVSTVYIQKQRKMSFFFSRHVMTPLKLRAGYFKSNNTNKIWRETSAFSIHDSIRVSLGGIVAALRQHSLLVNPKLNCFVSAANFSAPIRFHLNFLLSK